MHEIEIRAATIEEARKAAAFQLGVSEDRIEVEVVEEPRGVEGELGGTYRVRARLREDAFSPHAEEGPGVEEPEEAATNAGAARDFSRYSLHAPEEDVEEEDYEVPAIAGPPAAEPRPAAAPPRDDYAAYEADYEEEEEELGEPNLEVAGNARAFLEGLLPLLGVDAKVVVRYTGPEEVQIELVGPDLGILIGRYGSTLDAIQLLAAAAGNKGASRGARVILDAENYRQRRRESLENLAAATAAKVKRTGREVVLADLKASERRIIHLALKDDPAVETYSEGEGNRRRLVVAPRQGGTRPRPRGRQ